MTWLAAISLFAAFALAWYPCCGLACSGCTGERPSQMAVTFTGVTDDFCSDADPYFNDTFILDDVTVEDNCVWLFESTDFCGGYPLHIQVSFAGGNLNVDVWVYDSPAPTFPVSFYDAFDAEDDCAFAPPRSLTRRYYPPPGGVTPYNFSAASATVEAIA